MPYFFDPWRLVSHKCKCTNLILDKFSCLIHVPCISHTSEHKLVRNYIHRTNQCIITHKWTYVGRELHSQNKSMYHHINTDLAFYIDLALTQHWSMGCFHHSLTKIINAVGHHWNVCSWANTTIFLKKTTEQFKMSVLFVWVHVSPCTGNTKRASCLHAW